jgi:glycerol 2-dehydrogenase (NADP+)
VPREEIWLTTKLHNQWHQRVPEAINGSLEKLGTDYMDLYLIHWPCSTDPNDSKKMLKGWDFVDTWREMQKLLGSGKVKNVGVSNFGIKQLERLINDPSCKVDVLSQACPSHSPPRLLTLSRSYQLLSKSSYIQATLLPS